MSGNQQGSRFSRRRAMQIAAVAGGGVAAGLSLRGGKQVSAQQPPSFPQTAAQLVRLAEDTYMWQNGGYNSLIIISDEGALVTEPSSQFNQRSSTLTRNVIGWLTPMGVKYLVYSHDHPDHNTGGDAFGAMEIVSHELAAPKIEARNDPRSPVPTVTFAEHLTLDLGGKQIELHYKGRNHSDNSIVIEYPARRLIHGVDWLENRRLPFRDLSDSYVDEWIAGLEEVAAMDFDILVPGHTAPGNKQTVLDQHGYWLALIAAVKDARAAGHADNSPEMVDMVRAALTPTYSTWGSFADFLPLNIQGLIRIGSARLEANNG